MLEMHRCGTSNSFAAFVVIILYWQCLDVSNSFQLSTVCRQRRYEGHKQRKPNRSDQLNIRHLSAHQKFDPLNEHLTVRQLKVDPYRDSNNVRPSLHPITINILVQVLKLRASAVVENSSTNLINSNKRSTGPAWSDEPLDIVVTVANVASNAIVQRQKSSTVDEMILTKEEQQTITGRVIGVMVRLPKLQQLLYDKCKNVTWIRKYNEWKTFGLSESTSGSTNIEDYVDEPDGEKVNTYDELSIEFLNDPILLLNHAECLLALFIQTIEVPELLLKNCTVPDQSIIDFIDEDRRQVLLEAS